MLPTLALCLSDCRQLLDIDDNSVQDLRSACATYTWTLLCQEFAKFQPDENYLRGLCLLAQVDLAGTMLVARDLRRAH